MNSHAGITQEQVFEVADRILASGQSPTYKSIRENLKTGSFTTLAQHLAQWRKLKAEQAPTPPAPPDLHASTIKIWSTAYREAERQFANTTLGYEKEQEKWKDEKLEFLSIIQKLEQEREAYLMRDHCATAHVNQLNQELKSTGDRLTQLSTQLEGSELRRIETLERADRLEAQLTQLAREANLQKGEMMKVAQIQQQATNISREQS